MIHTKLYVIFNIFYMSLKYKMQIEK